MSYTHYTMSFSSMRSFRKPKIIYCTVVLNFGKIKHQIPKKAAKNYCWAKFQAYFFHFRLSNSCTIVIQQCTVNSKIPWTVNICIYLHYLVYSCIAFFLSSFFKHLSIHFFLLFQKLVKCIYLFFCINVSIFLTFFI